MSDNKAERKSVDEFEHTVEKKGGGPFVHTELWTDFDKTACDCCENEVVIVESRLLMDATPQIEDMSDPKKRYNVLTLAFCQQGILLASKNSKDGKHIKDSIFTSVPMERAEEFLNSLQKVIDRGRVTLKGFEGHDKK